MKNCDEFQGHKNYETWNVSLWLGNDEVLRAAMINADDYGDVFNNLRRHGITETPDGVAFNDSGLDYRALDEMVCAFKMVCDADNAGRAVKAAKRGLG